MNGRIFLNKLIANWPAKVLAIVMALFLYIFQQMNGMTSIRFDIPLVRNDNPELVSTTKIPEKVRVAISGADSNLGVLRENDITASIDLRVYNQPGTYGVPVEIRSLENAQFVDFLNINVSPGDIKVTLDRRAGKYIAVEPALKGEAAPGYELVQYFIVPKQIYVEGPASLVESIKFISTELIDITGCTESLVKNVRIADLGAASIQAHDSVVQFNAVIKSIDKIQEYTEIPVSVKNLDAGFIIKDVNITCKAVIQGNETVINNYKPVPGTFFINCAQIHTAGQYIIPLSVQISEGFTVLQYEPDTVSVIVSSASP